MASFMKAAATAATLALASVAPFAAGHAAYLPNTGAENSYFATFVQIGHACGGNATTAINIYVPQVLINSSSGTKIRIAYNENWTGWTSVDYPHTDSNNNVVPTKYGRGNGIEYRLPLNTPVPDTEWFEVGLRMKLPALADLPVADGNKLYIPVEQMCENGDSNMWVDIPCGHGEACQPAPYITLTPSTGGHGHGGGDDDTEHTGGHGEDHSAHGTDGTGDHSLHAGGHPSYFTTEFEGTYFLFKGWQVDSDGEYVATLLFFFIATIIYEWMTVMIAKIQNSITRAQNAGEKDAETGEVAANSTMGHYILRACLHFVRLIFSYCLMLVVMTYDVGAFFMIILGSTVGFAVFNHTFFYTPIPVDCH